MNQILNLSSHKQLIHITKANLHFGNTATIVINQTTLFQAVFENNEKLKKENGSFFLDWNCCKIL